MGRGEKGREEPEKTLSWVEIQQHTSRDDRWMVIDGEVYDVTNWSKKHPGGTRLMGHYAGQDASDAFGAFHNDQINVRKYLKPIRIGVVNDYVESDITDINKDFRQLKEEATKMGLFKPSYFFFSLMLGHIILLEMLAYLTLIWLGVSWWSVLLSVLLASIAQAQASWIQHDFGHLSVFRNSKIDHFLHHFTMGFLKASSSNWWIHMHNQHHAKPNVIDKDPDVRIEKLFVVGDVMPVEVAKAKKKSMPYNQQHKYFFLLGPPLLFPVYFQILLVRHVITRRLWKEFALILISLGVFFYYFAPLLGVFGSVAYYFAFRCLESEWFTWVSQSNHIPMKIKNDEANPWLKLQMYATCDIEKSAFNDWFTGHLNFQIEHHLFPTMPRHNLYKIAPHVKALCEKHGIPYIVKPIWQSFVDIVKTLKTSGKLWADTYKKIHSD